MVAIEYVGTVEGIGVGDLEGGFFEGWPNGPSAEVHLRLLEGSDHMVIAREKESGKVVGFATAISDGVLAAYIPLLEVLPEYRNRGIATEIMRRLLDDLSDTYMIDLLCDDDLRPFYERLGLRSGHAMMLRNYDRQDGSSGR